jgi:hypothetical protein
MPPKNRARNLKEILEEIQDLRIGLQRAEEKEGERQNAELKGMLRRRGLEIFRANPAHHLLFPPAFPEEGKGRFYELFKKYSFRLFLREVLNRRGAFRVPEVVRFSSAETGRKYLRLLLDLGLAEREEGRRYRLPFLSTTSLGPTLEWFMADIFRKEFFCPALHGLRCKGTRYGGDFDVVAALEGRLVYMEVKSSPPKNIEGDEVHEFFSRLEDLQPHIAFFFVDTELRLKDKMVPLLEAERAGRSYGFADPPRPAEKIGEEIFFLDPGIYLFGAKRSIITNLAACFRHFFAFSTAALFPLPIPVKRLV